MLASEQIRLWLGVFLFSLLPHVIGVDDSTILWLHRLDDLGVVGTHVLHEVTVHAQHHHLVDLIIRKQAVIFCDILSRRC